MALLSARTLRAGATAAVAASTLLLRVGSGVVAQTPRVSEYQVKALFLFNFAQFVNWPADAFTGAEAPIVICVLGEDPFGDFLDQTVRAERLGGRPLEVRRCRTLDEAKTCQILFISRSEGKLPVQAVTDLGRQPILTVSDADRFAQRGGMIRFLTDRSRIRLQINVQAAEAARLTISSKLLRVAEIVAPAGR